VIVLSISGLVLRLNQCQSTESAVAERPGAQVSD